MGRQTAGLLAVILQGNPISKSLAAQAARILKRAGKVLGLNVHPHVGDGLVAIDTAAEQAALVARLLLGDVAVKILQTVK